MTAFDDVVTRTNYDEAVRLQRRLAVELAQEIKTLGVLTPKAHTLADRILQADQVAERLRRQMIIAVAG